MIVWPNATAFSASLQNPQTCFKSPELRRAKIKQDAKGYPIGASGQFAVVYKATLPDQSNRAIRAFTSERPEMASRYHAIDEYLKKIGTIEPLVNFKYEPKGIKAIDGSGAMKSFPLVTMEWVPGQELYSWVRKQCQNSDQRSIEGVAERWLNLIQQLHDARIAHGDLQHANVMVLGNGQLKLVDYDCMCVPVLEGKQNLEIGVDPYQHPSRSLETRLSPDLDNFSSIFIFVVLRALAAEPRLWERHVEKINYDKLLIRPEDFKSPNSSELYRSLLTSRDGDVGRMTKQLFELYRADIEDVPRLRDMLVTPEMVRTALSQRDFDRAVELVERLAKVPAELERPVQNARDRVKRRKELEVAVDSGNEIGMQRLYDPRLLDDYPKAQLATALAKTAPQVIPILEKLHFAKQNRLWRDFEVIWDANRNLLKPRKSASPYAHEIGLCRERNQASDYL